MASKAGENLLSKWRYAAVVALCFCLALAVYAVAQRLDDTAYDVLSSRSSSAWTPQSVVVGIDEKTFDQFSRMGVPADLRSILPAALERLREAGPKLVAIDIILHDLGREEQDALVEKELRAMPNLILACELLPSGTWEEPLPRFAPADTRRLGHVESLKDEDGVTRRIPLEQAAAHEQHWALSLAALVVERNQAIQTTNASDDVQLGNMTIPVDPSTAGRPMLIRYLPEMPVISVVDIAKRSEEIRGKTVFLGETAQTAGDRIRTPSGEVIPGVMVHAQAFETLAHGEFLIQARPYTKVLISIPIAIAAGLIFGLFSGWQAFALDFALLAFAHYLPVFLFHRGIVISYLAPVATAWICSIGAAAYQFLFVRRQLEKTESERERYQRAIHWAAHEMRTPLTAIQGSSEIMTRYQNLPEQKRAQLSEMINSESKRLSRIIQTFLDVERLAEGQMELKREPFEFADVVDVCILRAKPLAERKQIELTLDSAVDGTILGDRELMEYAVYNLLTNAVKYSPAKTHVHVFCACTDGELRLSVQDEGMGMDAKELKDIFQKFYRTKRAEASGEVGTGIGLSIVEQIVAHHGGRISVTSEPGKGSCFTIVMKVQVPAAGNAKTADRRG